MQTFACAGAFSTERAFCGNRARKERGLLSMHSNNTFRPALNPGTRDDSNGLRRPPESSCTRARRETREKVGERVRENQAPVSLPLLLWPIIHWVTVRPSADQPWAAAPLMCIVYTGCHESTDLVYRQRWRSKRAYPLCVLRAISCMKKTPLTCIFIFRI